MPNRLQASGNGARKVLSTTPYMKSRTPTLVHTDICQGSTVLSAFDEADMHVLQLLSCSAVMTDSTLQAFCNPALPYKVLTTRQGME